MYHHPWAANMSFDAVRPAQATSTDSAFVGLSTQVYCQVYCYLFQTSESKTTRRAAISFSVERQLRRSQSIRPTLSDWIRENQCETTPCH